MRPAEDVSLWPGLPLSLSGDEVMHWITTQVVAAGCCMVVGWINTSDPIPEQTGCGYGDCCRLVVEDYQVIRLAGSLTARATRRPMKRNWMSRRWGKSHTCARGFAGDGHGFHRHPD